MLPHNNKWSKKKPSSISRLKQDELSPLETPSAEVVARRQRFEHEDKSSKTDYGLVSRGEEKTLQMDPHLRYDYFNRIQCEFLKYCSDPSNKDALRDEFSKEDVNVKKINGGDEDQKKDIDWVLMSLSK